MCLEPQSTSATPVAVDGLFEPEVAAAEAEEGSETSIGSDCTVIRSVVSP